MSKGESRVRCVPFSLPHTCACVHTLYMDVHATPTHRIYTVFIRYIKPYSYCTVVKDSSGYNNTRGSRTPALRYPRPFSCYLSARVEVVVDSACRGERLWAADASRIGAGGLASAHSSRVCQ